jgi:hypothetical protein
MASPNSDFLDFSGKLEWAFNNGGIGGIVHAPHSDLRVVDAGHFIWEDAADEYGALVNAWWAATRRARRHQPRSSPGLEQGSEERIIATNVTSHT